MKLLFSDNEEKPVYILRLPALTIYSIEFSKYKDFHNSDNSEDCVDGFLRNVKYRFKSGDQKWIKCSFTIENIQNTIYQGLRPNSNTRYWTVSLYDSNYFNEFIFYGLKQNILSRVIINYVTNDFISLSVKVLDNDAEAVI